MFMINISNTLYCLDNIVLHILAACELSCSSLREMLGMFRDFSDFTYIVNCYCTSGKLRDPLQSPGLAATLTFRPKWQGLPWSSLHCSVEQHWRKMKCVDSFSEAHDTMPISHHSSLRVYPNRSFFAPFILC